MDDLQKKILNVLIGESRSATGFDIYHKDFSSAMQHAYAFAKKKFGIEVDPKEIDKKVAMGPRKPSPGKTNSYRLKGKNGAIQVQVFNTGRSFELNMYKEDVETTTPELSEDLDDVNESRITSMDKEAKLEIFNKLKKGDNLKIKYNDSIRDNADYKDFVVTRNKRVVGKRRVEKITLQMKDRPGGVKFFLYSQDGSVSLAIGNMGAVINDMKIA